MSMLIPPALAGDVIRSGVEAAQSADAPMAVAMVDAGSNLVAFARTVDATGAAVDCAPAKARAALWFGRSTEDTLARAEGRPVVYQTLIAASPHPLVLSMGGICLYDGGTLVGAVAAAGATTGALDVEVATAMEAAWQEWLRSQG